MAFRNQTATLIVLIASQFAAHAQDLVFPVRHDRLHKGGEGILTFTDEIVRWEENKKPEHSRSGRYAEIQRLELAPGMFASLPTRMLVGNSDVIANIGSIICPPI
jgi:hypothetical protein